MKSSVKLTAIAAALTSTLAASGAHAFSDSELLIWIGGDKSYKGLDVLSQRFEEDMGIDVKIETPESLPDKFQQASATGKGPDIVFWAHDRFAEWADSGLLAPLTPSAETRDSLEAKGWQATTHKGTAFGYPIAMEAISVIYNKKLLDKAPTSYEAMFELNKTLSKKGITTIMWDQGNPYFSTPMLMAGNAYIYKEVNGGYDVKDAGIATTDAIRGGEMFVRLIEEGVTPRGVDYGVMESNFNKGKTAMMVSGPWAWANLEKSGIDYGVAPLPTINGKPTRALVGVWAAGLNNASPNKELAAEFIENYLLTEDGLKTMNDDRPLGAVTHKAYMAQLAADPRIQTTYENAMTGILMPNVPQMMKFWSGVGNALLNIANDQSTPEEALKFASKMMVN